MSASHTLLNVNMTNVTKLNATNFLMWSRQVHALLDGYDLAGYVDGSMVVPSSTVTENQTSVVNPDYLLWKRQDRLIYSALLGAISTSLQPLLSTATTAAEIWSTLKSTYAKPSRAHFKQLKHQLKNWKKEAKTIHDYFQGLTTRFDQIALLGKPLDHEDQIVFVLEGLPEEYRPIIDQIEGRDTPPSLTEVHERLLNHEVKLQTAAVPSSLPVSANVVTYNGNRSSQNNNNRNQPRSGNYNCSGNRNTQTWQQQQSFSPRPDQRQSQSRGYQGRCQLCGVHGHSAQRCSQLPRSGSSYGSSHISVAPWQPRAHLAETAPQ